MKIVKVMVNRKFNLGNYETLDMAAEAELNDNDNPLEVWQIIRDNIEMEYITMQQKKTKQEPPKPLTPSQPVEPVKPKANTTKEGDTCPKCGAKKKPGFLLCYNCHEEEKAT